MKKNSKFEIRNPQCRHREANEMSRGDPVVFSGLPRSLRSLAMTTFLSFENLILFRISRFFTILIITFVFIPAVWAQQKDVGLTRPALVYKKTRAYSGAPPVIPHEIEENTKKINCLSCHQYGGYAPSLKKNIPKTPHPEWSHCLQCHVPQRVQGTFKNKGNEFPQWSNANEIPKKTLESAPPVIPHGPQYRDNCVACHTGPAAVKGFKSDHPERLNCLQCHVWQNQKEQLIIK